MKHLPQLALVCFVIMSPACGRCRLDDPVPLVTLDCQHGHKIRILEEGGLEVVQPPALYYQVMVGERSVVGPTLISTVGDSDQVPGLGAHEAPYRCLSSQDGTVVGVVARSMPHSVMVIHDFGTAESWPYDLDKYHGRSVDEVDAAIQRLVDRLSADHPELSKASKLDDRLYLEQASALDLSYSPIEDTRLAKLEGLTQLEVLDLRRTRVTDAGIAELVELPRLRVLRLANTEITDAAVASLARLPHLRTLDVSGTRMTPAGIESLRRALPMAVVTP